MPIIITTEIYVSTKPTSSKQQNKGLIKKKTLGRVSFEKRKTNLEALNTSCLRLNNTIKKQTNAKSIPADDKANIAWEIGEVISGFKGILGGESKGGYKEIN